VDGDAARGELLRGGVAVRVLAKCAEEVDLSAQLGEHHRGDAPASRRAGGRGALRVEHFALAGHPRDRDEIDPLDVADYRYPLHVCEGTRTAMGTINGSSTAEIDAPLDRVWALVEDVEKAPEWQGGLKGMHAIERDGENRATLCEAETDAKVRTIKSTVRFEYDGPTTLRWRQEKGELKSVDGSWDLEDLGSDRTRATYRIEVDLGRVLSLVIRGPLVDLLRGQLAGARAGELKRAIESG
jgi:carbon monoxide dehydrogenase subunit G